ncbi:Abi family protein [Chlorobaculum sp. MV4-Y]|uniref:Abi family protein n=1 Tax=Chlorobaculum sp. MV4-Y TaxID=2976335 RepID=UPI0021AEF902|nr:Abi family protein [Chlorobaculum sp. MV4-Y]UWX57733.1 Abi family protein [Chlorobaculum sp. MV4-Y]
MHYNKQSISLPQQIQQLKSRGLCITDESAAEHHLRNISYYRLAGYWWPMQSDKVNHVFKPNSRFEDVIALYSFDSDLRLLVFKAIERIEIGLRTRMINHLSQEIDPWWFENQAIFTDQKAFTTNLSSLDRELRKSREVFIQEHFKKYHADHRRPPAWKSLEVASFGLLSKRYGNLKPGIKSKDTIASELGTVNHTFLKSWLQSISQIRNICAHHSRLWNKNLPGRPKLMANPPLLWVLNSPHVLKHHQLYVHLCCMKYLLDAISPGHRFPRRLKHLFQPYRTVDQNALGFPAQWQADPFWQ